MDDTAAQQNNDKSSLMLGLINDIKNDDTFKKIVESLFCTIKWSIAPYFTIHIITQIIIIAMLLFMIFGH